MATLARLIPTLTALLPEEGRVLVLNSEVVAAALRAERPDVAAVLPPEARAAAGAEVERADLLALPVPERSLACVLAVEAMGRLADRAAAVDQWSRRLAPGGRLLLVERVRPGGLARGLRRLRGIGPAPEPEDLCALLLNAGLQDVGQVWPQGAPERVVTVGSVRTK